MIDNKDLAEYLYNEISEHQSDNEIRRTRPQVWPTGLFFNTSDIEGWIKQFKCSGCVGQSRWSERYQMNIWEKVK